MLSNLFSLALTGLAATNLVSAQSSWGGAVSLGPSTANIISAVTTLVPGVAPSTQNGELFLWPGMSNGTGDLIQTTLESWPSNSWCGATAGEWCIRCSIFGSFGQIDGNAGIVKGTDAVTISYTLQSDKNTWLQTATINGVQVSSLSYAAGPYMKGYGTGTECDDYCSGTVASQTYTNTVITFDAADTNFGNTLVTSGGATYSGLSSSQGGKVWTIASMYVPPMVTTAASSTTKATSTTKASSTSTKTSTSAGSTATGGAPLYGQCGGIGWTGPTTCAQGTCTYSNAYYSQCI
ncbi:hypothetical protein DL93DRAFT_2088538 [Clavulina sp. PMI_390]|nr:hypothetical protein DL93DRAFT_2088538 [Clavulina sp. PMI_390]